MRPFSTRLKAPRVPFYVAWTLLVAAVLLALPATLLAQAGDVATTAVARFADKTGRASSLLEVKATDAVALALADSREYLVTPAREVDREVQALGLTPPLAMSEAVRLGKRLDVDSVCLGEVLSATVDTGTGKGVVRLQVMMVDVEAAEVLDGATVDTSTKGIPGWSGTEADILNEALRQAAEEAVARTLSSRVRRGSVEAVLPSGTCEINLGSQDGAAPGMKLVVMRPVYLRELETVTLRKIGYVEVSRTQPDLSYADPLKDVAPRTGDYVLRVYQPYAVVKTEAAKQDRTKFLWGIGTIALLIGLAGVATGNNEGTSPPTPISYLHQEEMGDIPTIRVEFAQWDKAFGHLLFRGPSRSFPADAYWLVEVFSRGMGEQRIKKMDDLPDAFPQKTITITVNFTDEEGDPATEDVECIYMHPALQPGESYFHRVQRVTEPQFPPGTNPPIATGGSTDAAFQGPDENEINQDYDFPMLSDATQAVGPVTYIVPVEGLTVNGNAEPLPQNPAGPIVFAWSATEGADEYLLEVFPESDPQGTGNPILHRDGIRPTGSSIAQTWNPATGDLDVDSTYYWRVGARKAGDLGSRGQGVPQVGEASPLTGWVLSSRASFTTVTLEPPGLSTSAVTPAAKKTGKAARGTTVTPDPSAGGITSARKNTPQERPGKGARGGRSGKGGFSTPVAIPNTPSGGWGAGR